MYSDDDRNLFETGDESQSSGHIIRIAFESGADREFDYFVPDKFWPVAVGQRVEAPFGRNNKRQVGFCVKADITPEKSFASKAHKLKKITDVIDREPLLDAQLMELAQWIRDYYVCPLGQVLAAMVPAAVKTGAGEKTEKLLYLAISNQPLEIKSKQQRLIVEFLQKTGAVDSQNVVELKELLSQVGCTDVPVKRLAEKGIIKIVKRTVLKTLPAIPQALMLEQKVVVLNEDQRKALAHIQKKIEEDKFGVTLLYGVTDSGKTELYIRAIEACLRRGKSAIVLLPEIALTAQTVQRFSSRFEKIAVMHSGLTAAERNSQWHKINSGGADVVIGARSAVFAPLSNLGLIVVDEEHEPSYKQDIAPRYHGRDVAIKRAQLANAHCILGSATPSLETLVNCQRKKHFSLVCLPKRVMNLPMPEMKLVDLQKGFVAKKGVDLISIPLEEQLRQALAKNEQAILLLNRRGYSNFIFCPSCGYSLHCHNCDVALTFHKSNVPEKEKLRTITGGHIGRGSAICHHCGAETLVPEKCPLCGKGIAMIGMGSQKLEEELAIKFPHAKVARVDSDSMASGDYYRLLKDFSEGRIDILAGTQMLAKGLHFPNVTVVGIISADTCLYLPDFRSNERTFQLISQVAGRAGRSEKKGIVFVQTFFANQPAIQFALKGDFTGFVEEELKHRKVCNLPPFWRLAAIVLRDQNFNRLEAACDAMKIKIDEIIEQHKLEIRVRGPMPAVISRIQRFHRMVIILQSPQASTMQRLFSVLRRDRFGGSGVKVAVDIDPVNLL